MSDQPDIATGVPVSLDASQLLGFCHLAAVASPGSDISVEALSRLMSKSGEPVIIGRLPHARSENAG